MTGVRLLDFLVNKIGNITSKVDETEKVKFETVKLEKQNDILNKHLPELIDYSPSSFDKISKSKNITEFTPEILKEIISKIK